MWKIKVSRSFVLTNIIAAQCNSDFSPDKSTWPVVSGLSSTLVWSWFKCLLMVQGFGGRDSTSDTGYINIAVVTGIPSIKSHYRHVYCHNPVIWLSVTVPVVKLLLRDVRSELWNWQIPTWWYTVGTILLTHHHLRHKSWRRRLSVLKMDHTKQSHWLSSLVPGSNTLLLFVPLNDINWQLQCEHTQSL